MYFEIEGEITEVETFATGRSIRELSRLNKFYGKGRWRKRKGNARVRLNNGESRFAELHWYEQLVLARKNIKSNGF